MSAAPHTPLSKIRTFAQDQARARGEAVPVSPATPLPPTTPPARKEPSPAPTPKKVAPIVVTAPAPAVEHSPAKLPAFHELKKTAHHIHTTSEVPKIETAPDKKKVIVRQPQQRVNVSLDTEVLTANKKSEFKLFPSMVTAFTQWLHSFSKTSKNPHAYTIATVDRRKGVVQKATSGTGTLFTADNDTLKEEIQKRRALQADHAHISLSWTPHTEVGYPLLEPVSNQSAAVEKKATLKVLARTPTPPPIITEPRVTPQKETPPVASPSTRRFVPPEELTEFIEPQPRPSVTIFTSPDPLPVQAPVAAYVPSVPVEPTVPEVPPAFVPQVQASAPAPLPIDDPIYIPKTPNPRTSYLTNGLRQLVRFDTNLATVVTVGSILSFVLMFFIVRSFLGIISPTAEQIAVLEDTVPSISSRSDARAVAISSLDQTALFSALLAEPRPASGVHEFSITDAAGVPVPADTLWKLFGFNTNPNLIRSIKNVRVGFSNGEHMLVLEVTDTTTVFGALLAWETTMLTDITQLFTKDTVSGTKFTDAAVQGHDVRVLTNGPEELLVYGFIDSNIVVITESTEAFMVLLGDSK